MCELVRIDSREGVEQHQLEELHPGNTVYEELDRVAPQWSMSQIRSLLGYTIDGDVNDFSNWTFTGDVWPCDLYNR